ncbi:MAG: helix-turn-helix domain-containing protein [Zetaproteobacteria bacterium]|nr:MAG: helix-turn-helix domain-containing protein [Zetaproteobacteria bacterium]
MIQSPSPIHGCPIGGLLDIMGERWSFLILRDAFYGVRRFDGFQQHLGISKKVLSQRLRKLVVAEILRRVQYQEHPARYEYRLTARGRDLFPVVLTMMRWGNRWLTEPGQEWLELKHKSCGKITEPKVVCNHCHEPLTLARVQALPGPGATKKAIQALRKATTKSK